MRIALFIVWPFAAFVHAFLNRFRSKTGSFILFAICGFVGLTLAIDNPGSDIHVYIRSFESFEFISLVDFWEKVILAYLSLSSEHGDIGHLIIYFIVSRFCLAPKILLLFLGLVFGYFYAKVIYNTTRDLPNGGLLSGVLFVLMVLVIFPTQGINQRFWIAGMMFILGVQKYICNKHTSGLILILLSPIMHMGMSLLVLSVILYRITKSIPTVFLLVLIPFCIYLSHNLAAIFEPVFTLVGGIAEKKFAGYSGDLGEELISQQNSRVWYALYYREGTLIGLSTLTLLAYRDCSKHFPTLKKLLSLNIYLLLFVSLVSQFSMSFRYFELMIFFQAMLLYQFIKLHPMGGLFKTIYFVSSPFIILTLGLKFAGILQLLEPSFFITNVFTEWLSGEMGNAWSHIDVFNN